MMHSLLSSVAGTEDACVGNVSDEGGDVSVDGAESVSVGPESFCNSVSGLLDELHTPATYDLSSVHGEVDNYHHQV